MQNVGGVEGVRRGKGGVSMENAWGSAPQPALPSISADVQPQTLWFHPRSCGLWWPWVTPHPTLGVSLRLLMGGFDSNQIQLSKVTGCLLGLTEHRPAS